MAVKHECGIDSHAKPDTVGALWWGTMSVTPTYETGKMKIQLDGQALMILSLYSIALYMQSDQL